MSHESINDGQGCCECFKWKSGEKKLMHKSSHGAERPWLVQTDPVLESQRR